MQLCKNLSFRKAFHGITDQSGLKGLYRSYWVTLSMNVPYAAVVVSVNENMKTLVQPWNRKHQHTWYFICAGVAGGAAAVVTNPLDVVKTRL